mmetsp:Transcript_68602/g.178679  ORF Transcript_68602/g.178679 Transcript_68602/m.178679 type:complete len:310 (+) Transcript_68602:36-965(+)
MKTERGRLPPVRCGIHRLAALLLAGRAAAAGGTRPGARGQRSLQQQATRPPERQTTPPQQPGPQSALHQAPQQPADPRVLRQRAAAAGAAVATAERPTVPASLGARPVGSAPRAARSGGIALVALGGSAADSPDAPVEAPTTTTPDGYRSKFLLDMFGLRTSANGTRIEELEDFMPQCLAHLHRVIRRVDRWYTDEQLGVLLSRECDLDQTFLSYEDGFKHREACEEFGADLTKARFEELASGSTKGYLEFCEKYHAHLTKEPTTTATTTLAELPVREGSEWWWNYLIVGMFILVFACLLGALVCLKVT